MEVSKLGLVTGRSKETSVTRKGAVKITPSVECISKTSILRLVAEFWVE